MSDNGYIRAPSIRQPHNELILPGIKSAKKIGTLKECPFSFLPRLEV
jgi:hypothetical protein